MWFIFFFAAIIELVYIYTQYFFQLEHAWTRDIREWMATKSNKVVLQHIHALSAHYVRYNYMDHSQQLHSVR